MGRIELLAPAKDLETGMAAVNCGADAVYLGAGQFGAREAAGNSLESIASLVNYAHKYWARVYVTVNTLLRDEELPAAQRMIHDLYQIGVMMTASKIPVCWSWTCRPFPCLPARKCTITPRSGFPFWKRWASGAPSWPAN
jgi:hypothetical protein